MPDQPLPAMRKKGRRAGRERRAGRPVRETYAPDRTFGAHLAVTASITPAPEPPHGVAQRRIERNNIERLKHRHPKHPRINDAHRCGQRNAPERHALTA